MTKQFIYSSAMVALLAGSFASCSSDDTLDGNVAENELAPISLTVTSDEETSHSTIARTGIVFEGGSTISGTQNVWEKGDVVWVYSTANTYFNKLESVSNSQDAFHEKELNFSSGSNKVSYEPNERVILFNTGVNDGTTNQTDGTIKLTRASDDNLMVCVYGDGETVPTYSDEGNAFSMRRVSAVLKEDGMFYKTTSADKASTASLQNTYTKVYFTMPALDAEDAAKLAKLTYKIVVKATDSDDNSGYPQTVSYTFDNTLVNKSGSNGEKVFDDSSVETTWGKQLQVKFTANGADARHQSKSLWNTTAGADDVNQGMVFFLLPPNIYKSISVKVRVEAPAGETLDDNIKALCKTYTYTYAPEDEDKYYDNSDPNAKSINGFQTEKLGDIWVRNTSAAKPVGFLAKSGASTGWVVTEND